MSLLPLLRRRLPVHAFVADPIDRRRLDVILEAGRYLPAGEYGGACRAVAIEAPGIRRDLVAALRTAGIGDTTARLLDGAPVLVVLCGAAETAGPAAWMTAAQIALAAEEEGLAAVTLGPPGDGFVPPPAVIPGADQRVAMVLALGRPVAGRGVSDPVAPARRTGEVFRAATPPPAFGGSPEGAEGMLASYMEIARASAGADDMDALVEQIARTLGRLFPIDGASLALAEEGGITVREILRRDEAVRCDPERLPADESHLFGWVMARDQALWRNDIDSEIRFSESLPAGGMASDMVIPLKARGRVIGAFRVSCLQHHAFDPEDFRSLQRCADLTAVAVDNRRLLLRAKRLSETDGLTGISNHRHFVELLGQEAERSRRVGRPLSLIMLDIDDFKRINDRYGHPAGDAVLTRVAQLVAGLLRRSDVVARYGGEEFAAILPDAGPEPAAAVAETVRSEVERRPIELPASGSIAVRISLGVATLPDDADSAAALVAAADGALYQAKRSGKNRVCRAGDPDRRTGIA